MLGVFREDVRRRLLSNQKLTLQGVIDKLTLEERVDKDAHYFNKIRPSNRSFSKRDDLNEISRNLLKFNEQQKKGKYICYRCGGTHFTDNK